MDEELLGALLGALYEDEELEGMDPEDLELEGLDIDDELLGSIFSKLKNRLKSAGRRVRNVGRAVRGKSPIGRRRSSPYVNANQLMAPTRVSDRSPLLSSTGLRPDSVGKKYIGTGLIQWTNATGAVVQAIEIEPQIPFRTYRIVAAFERVGLAGAAILTSVPTLESLVIGVKNQAASPGAVPLACFAPNAWGVDLSLDSADRGTTLVLQCGLNVAPGVGETVNLGIMLTGVTVG